MVQYMSGAQKEIRRNTREQNIHHWLTEESPKIARADRPICAPAEYKKAYDLMLHIIYIHYNININWITLTSFKRIFFTHFCSGKFVSAASLADIPNYRPDQGLESGEEYTNISKALITPWNTVKTVIIRWRKYGLTVTLSRTGKPPT